MEKAQGVAVAWKKSASSGVGMGSRSSRAIAAWIHTTSMQSSGPPVYACFTRSHSVRTHVRASCS